MILIACIIHMGTAMVLKVSTNLSFFFFENVAEEKSLQIKRTVTYLDWKKKLHVSLCNQRFPVSQPAQIALSKINIFKGAVEASCTILWANLRQSCTLLYRRTGEIKTWHPQNSFLYSGAPNVNFRKITVRKMI